MKDKMGKILDTGWRFLKESQSRGKRGEGRQDSAKRSIISRVL